MSNDFKPAPTPENLEPIVRKAVANPKKHRKPVMNAIINPDIQDINHWLLFDIILPKGKRFIADALVSAINGFFGTSFSSSGYSQNRTTATASNVRMYNYATSNTAASTSASTTVIPSIVERYSKLYWVSRTDANDVKAELYRILSAQGYVYAADLLRLAGAEVDSVCYRWGWKDLTGCEVIFHQNVELRDSDGNMTLGGYWLRMPRAQAL